MQSFAIIWSGASAATCLAIVILGFRWACLKAERARQANEREPGL